MKKKSKPRRTRKKRGADYSALAKKTIRRNAENQKKKKFQTKFNAKVKETNDMTPLQLMRKRPKRLSPGQVKTGKNIPYPIGGGKRRSRKRKRKSRRKRRRTKII